jgi:hypothetical protein
MAHDLAGISQGEDAKVSWKLRPVMRWASFLFHHAEKFNRQATFVAAYRLAREADTPMAQAYEQAVKATYDGHFDYSAANRPRIMQGNAAKVILLFKQYGQNMVYTLARQAYLSMKGKNQFERAQARKALGGLLTMHAAAAGVLGLPMVSTLLAAASMLGSDDDEPWDAEVALRNMLAEALGDQAADVLARGLSRLTPWDISGRVGLDKLILPDIQEGLEGQRLGESAMAAALGPVAGIGVALLKGMQEISDGNFARGLEAMAPSLLRGPARAVRYASEGAIDKTGKPIVETWVRSALPGRRGFSPSRSGWRQRPERGAPGRCQAGQAPRNPDAALRHGGDCRGRGRCGRCARGHPGVQREKPGPAHQPVADGQERGHAQETDRRVAGWGLPAQDPQGCHGSRAVRHALIVTPGRVCRGVCGSA